MDENATSTLAGAIGGAVLGAVAGMWLASLGFTAFVTSPIGLALLGAARGAQIVSQ